MLAAVSPCPGGNLFAKGRWYTDPESYRRNAPYQLPLICVGGTMDGGDRYPLEEPEHLANFDIWMEHVVKVTGFTPLSLEASRALAEVSADPAKRAFGFAFHRTFAAVLEDLEWAFGDFAGESGVTVARFVSRVGLPHAVTAHHAPLVWDFISLARRRAGTKRARIASIRNLRSRRAAPTTRRASAAFTVKGFSQTTALPASSARIAHSA